MTAPLGASGFARGALDLLFPRRCAFCGRIDRDGLCADCDKKLPYREHLLREDSGFGRCAAPLRYEGGVREALRRFKFQGGRNAAAGFGLLIARAAAECYPGEFTLVTYAPVSAARKRERGYDQAELLARAASALWETKPVALLRKTKNNPAQSGIQSPQQRRDNVRDIYEAAAPERIRGGRILLIDDIVTTGSTLSECVRVLRENGAESVVCACVASARS